MLNSIVEERKLKEATEVEERKLKEAREHELDLERIRMGSNVVKHSEENSINCENGINLENLIRSVKMLTIPTPNKSEMFNFFFVSLERAFKIKRVPDEYKSEILINLLGEKAVNALTYIKEEELSSYESIKKLILKEHEPTAQACLQNFRNSRRHVGETHSQFAARLTAAWKYYCELRKITDVETLHELIISDKLMQSLDQETACHISIRQGDGWLKPSELAKECDIYYASKKKSFNETPGSAQKYYNSNNEQKSSGKYIPPPLRKDDFKNKLNKGKDCYICGGNHIAKFCKNRYKSENIRNDSRKERKENTDALVSKINARYFKSDEIKPYVQPLKYVNLLINGQDIECILDSGCQIPVIHSKHIQNCKDASQGKIVLISAFGERTSAALMRISLALSGQKGMTHPHETVVAVSDKLNVSTLIPPDVYSKVLNQEYNYENLWGDDKLILNNLVDIQSNESEASVSNEIDYDEGEEAKQIKISDEIMKLKTNLLTEMT